MVSREEFDALRAAHEELREEFVKLRKAHATLMATADRIDEQRRLESMAAEDVIIATARTARALVHGFPAKFDDELMIRAREKRDPAPVPQGYFYELQRLSDILDWPAERGPLFPRE